MMLDMAGTGRLGLGCRGAQSAWGARTKSGTMRGKTEARDQGGKVMGLLASAPTSCFWGWLI